MGELRTALHRALHEDAWPPGRWLPSTGQGLNDEEAETLGNPSTDDAALEDEINDFFLQEEAPAGAYAPFDMERDHTGRPSTPWYRSPGRAAGGDGDPFRPADPHAYIGMHSPSGPADPTAGPPAAAGEGGTAARLAPPIWQLSAGSNTSKVLGANAKAAAPEVPSNGEQEETQEVPGQETPEGAEPASQRH